MVRTPDAALEVSRFLSLTGLKRLVSDWNTGFQFDARYPAVLEPYPREDQLLDELEQLPSPELVRKLIQSLKTIELREISEGMVIDCVSATRRQDIVEL